MVKFHKLKRKTIIIIIIITETFSEWRKKFENMTIDVKDLIYGDMIGEGSYIL